MVMVRCPGSLSLVLHPPLASSQHRSQAHRNHGSFLASSPVSSCSCSWSCSSFSSCCRHGCKNLLSCLGLSCTAAASLSLSSRITTKLPWSWSRHDEWSDVWLRILRFWTFSSKKDISKLPLPPPLPTSSTPSQTSPPNLWEYWDSRHTPPSPQSFSLHFPWSSWRQSEYSVTLNNRPKSLGKQIQFWAWSSSNYRTVCNYRSQNNALSSNKAARYHIPSVM